MHSSSMDLPGSIVLLGAPGLLLGAGVGALARRWKLVVALAAVGAIGLWLGIKFLPNGPDDDDPAVLLALAMLTNYVGWLVGLVVGLAARRSRRHARGDRRASDVSP